MSHTQGPWTTDGQMDRGIIVSAPGRRARQIVTLVQTCIGYEPDPRPEAEANARLIAAAPDLLEAAKAIDRCIVWRDDLQCYTLAPDGGPLFAEKLNLLRNAIAMAEPGYLP